VDYLKSSRNFRATSSLTEGLEFADIYFIVAPTNSIPGIETYDHTILSNILKEIDDHKVSNKHIVICSTIFPGYIRNSAIPLISNCINTDISYNPEFIAQGNIIQGLFNPDIVLIGEGSFEAGDLLSDIYKNMCTNTPHIARMSTDSAEIAKLALNCFVTAKIAFANLIGDIADETPGADKYAILSTIGKDKRIGSQCLFPGYGFGGPCFPRDNRALGNYAELQGIDPLPLRSTDLTNKNHTLYMANKLLEDNLSEYFFEDVSYKPNCPVPIIEASQKLEIAVKIAESGKKVTIKDKKEVIVQIIEKYGNLFIYEVLE
ncbi:MAG: UDP-glucose/GDP-mannose dehydrogenase family protein, partial [Verrucomicrobia bacterium]|nr:UDP-glucose/GDP-mannose dehydrogenase family protein [Verrucomicrobiota bacterium]